MSKYCKLPTVREDISAALPWSDDLSVLGTPVKIGEHTAVNRIVYQPMEGCDGTADGNPGELTERRYMRFADGGPAIIWFEATAVTESGRANPRQLMITGGNTDEFKRLVYAIKERSMARNGYEPLVICQLTHSGRYSKPHGLPEPVIAYNNPLFEKDNPIDSSCIVTDDELEQIGVKLAEGARLAESAGFDGADIKASHRYLLSELLSAYERPGRYGGCFENRTRLLSDAFGAAGQLCGRKFILTSRINAYDAFPYPYGFGVNEGEGIKPDMSEAIRLCTMLKNLGAGLINVTMGNPYVNPWVNRPTASYSELNPMEGTVNMLCGIRDIALSVPGVSFVSSALTYLGATAPNIAAACINNGWFAFAGFGRQSIAYPELARDILNGGMDKDKLCVTCGNCSVIMRSGRTPGCVVRDSELYMPLFRQVQEEKRSKNL